MKTLGCTVAAFHQLPRAVCPGTAYAQNTCAGRRDENIKGNTPVLTASHDHLGIKPLTASGHPGSRLLSGKFTGSAGPEHMPQGSVPLGRGAEASLKQGWHSLGAWDTGVFS